MRSSLFIALLLTCRVTNAAEAPRESAALARPNVLFIFIDDMGWADPGCFGGTLARTPEIDRLAGEGVRFTQFYVNAPICSPSRVAVTTGQYPNRWQITSFLATRQEDRRRGIADWLDPKAPSLARFLASAGYHTAHVGKWHMGGQRDVGNAPPITDYGFATSLTNFEGLGERLLPIFEPATLGKAPDHGPTRMSAELGGPIRWVDRHDVTARFVDRAIEEMQRAAEQHRPFYINFWPDDVHSPVQAPPGKRGDGSPRDNYRGVVEELDRQLGRLFDYIRSKPELRDNTLILLASDNGPEQGLGSAGTLRGSKGMLYEGGIRSPLIAWSARMAPAARGTTNDKTVLAGMDLPPSILALTGVSAPAGTRFDGQDMSEALTGRTMLRRESAVMWVRPPDRPGPENSWPDLAIRDGDYKLLVFREGAKPELYDITRDPKETTNLAAQEPDLTRRLAERVIAWDREIRASAAPRKRAAAQTRPR